MKIVIFSMKAKTKSTENTKLVKEFLQLRGT